MPTGQSDGGLQASLMEASSQLELPLPGGSHLYPVDKTLTRTSFFLIFLLILFL